jgi:hypothetical protein
MQSITRDVEVMRMNLTPRRLMEQPVEKVCPCGRGEEHLLDNSAEISGKERRSALNSTGTGLFQQAAIFYDTLVS